MANLSKIRRDEMLAFLETLREENKENAKSLYAINQIEEALNKKKYGLVWEEHSEHVDEMLEDNIPIFTEIKEREINVNDGPVNFLLEGDNLHSLKLLEKTHTGKIDVIYIDPPYNRGKNDFIYDDDFIIEEDGYRHSKWLSFMKRRLVLAHQLLAQDGFIFVSIDDNEVSTLRLLLSEIFGEHNFVNTFIWKRNSSVKTEKDKFTINTEYILLYSKSRNFILNPTYKPLAKSSQKMFNKDDHDGRGKYQTVSLQKPRDPGPETTYDYVDNTGKVWPCPAKGWRMKFEKIKALENDGRLVLTGNTLRVKDYWNERSSEGKRIDTMWDDLPENSTGSNELESALGGEKNTFSNPKPTRLIERCLEIGKKNAIVLDFFAGSGTTGQAVLQLNQKDGGERKFILCTNNQNNICENVTYRRLVGVQSDLSHNLKYYRTDYVQKFEENDDVTSQILPHCKELIALEHMCSIDGRHILYIDNEALADEKITDALVDDVTIFLAADILLDAKQQAILDMKSANVIRIPEYYYKNELMEVGEL